MAGAMVGAAIGALIIAGTALTGGMLLVAVVAVVGGCIAAGGLSGGMVTRGLSKAANLSGPTTGRLVGGSPNVTVNSRAALRTGVDYADGCNGLPINHPPLGWKIRIAEGSKIVTVNGKPMARLSMKLECGAQIKTGSHNVTVGGPTARVLTVIDTEEIFGGALEVLGIVALAAGGALAFAAAGLLGVRAAKRRKGGRGLWQRRFWEHWIADEEDLRRPMDCVHINPVEHGHVARASEWPYGSMHRYIRQGWMSQDWTAGTRDNYLVGER